MRQAFRHNMWSVTQNMRKHYKHSLEGKHALCVDIMGGMGKGLLQSF